MNWALLQNSLLVSSAATLGALLLGSVVALWLAALSPDWRRWFLAGAVIGLALPPFLVTNCWLDLLGQGGVWRRWLPLNIYTLGGTIWILTLLLWPISTLLVLGAIQKVQPGQLEADPLLRGWSCVRWLLLPLSGPALSEAAVITLVLALNNFAVPAILQTKVYPAELWVSFNTTFDYGATLRLSWPLLLLPLLLLRWLRPGAVVWPRREMVADYRLLRRHLGRTLFVAAGLLSTLAFVLSVALPAGQLGLRSRTWLELPSAFAAGSQAVWHSLLFAGSGATLCALVGLGLWRWSWGTVLWVPLLVPGVLLGMALIFVLNRGPLVYVYQSYGVVLIALACRYTALSWAGARQAMQSVDRSLLDYARLNGASAWQRLRYVFWPQIGTTIAACWFVTYLLCLWDVESLVLVIPPGGETLAVRIFNLLHYGHNAQVNAVCVLLLGLAVLPLVAWTLSPAGRRRFGTAAALGMLLASSGCGPAVSNESKIESRFFSKVQIVGTRGTGIGQFNKPRSLAVDAQDNLYVVDMTGRIQKFSSNGVFLLSWQMPEIEKGRPKGMCRDKAGNIVVVEPHYARVNHFSPQGKLLNQWGSYGTNAGQLCLPRAAAITSPGDVVVCEYTLVDRVQIFSSDGGSCRLAFGHSGVGPGELNRPEGLAVDAADEIFVADSCNHRIQVFSKEGKYLRNYGRAGTGPGELSYPYDIKLDRAGNQYVAEFGNSRLQVFDARGNSLEIIGGPGAAPGQFSNPCSIAFDSAGNLYVADSQNHRVQKFIHKGS